ncbi:MAG: Na(+)/H(+) antiporter subunit B [Cyanobacteriota bacterium]|nr:Na(+)/H(+) antiporter subunit B [Cyanobacteriota bacterium]
MTYLKKISKFSITAETLKSTLYLVAISAVMLLILFTRDDSVARDTEAIVAYLSEYTKIPNTVTSVILVTRLFDTIGEVTVFTIAGLGVKILLHDEDSVDNFSGINDQAIKLLLDFVALLSCFLAIDLAIKGHLTPGGGFASGVAGATSITLLMMTGRLKQLESFYTATNAPALEKLAVVAFIGVALATFASFLYPTSQFAGIPPTIYIPALNIIAALKVTIGSWSILRLFIVKRGVF